MASECFDGNILDSQFQYAFGFLHGNEESCNNPTTFAHDPAWYPAWYLAWYPAWMPDQPLRLQSASTLTSVVQDFENYPATEYDLGEDHEYYRPGVAGYVADKVHGGSKAIHRKGLTSGSDEFPVNYDDELTVGAEYKLKFWIMTDTAGASGNISLAFKTWPDILEKNNGVEKILSVSSLKQNEWTEVI